MEQEIEKEIEKEIEEEEAQHIEKLKEEAETQKKIKQDTIKKLGEEREERKKKKEEEKKKKEDKKASSATSSSSLLESIVEAQKTMIAKLKLDYGTEYYEKIFGLSTFVRFDDGDISTRYSALKSVVLRSKNWKVKLPINEPAQGLKKSQIEEYLEFNEGAGVQHIAILTDDIISSIRALKENGVEFLDIPKTYYDDLLLRVGGIDEEIEKLKELSILVDRDEHGYLLQIFTKPLEDRPTLFIEIIQRKGSKGFGQGNFQALFESIEKSQAERGNL